MSRHVTCFTTIASQRDARKIARKLVSKQLVACVNIVPTGVSFYRWKKKLRHGREVLMMMKTLRSKIASLKTALAKHHPYELPEFIVLPIVGGSKAYLKWIEESVKT